MKCKETRAITLGGIYAAIYAVLTAVSIYAFPFLSVFSLLIMPIFAAYYASVYNYKWTLLFNLTTLLLCFIVGLGDPIYVLLYVLPTLIVGDLFGIFNQLKLKYFTTVFLQTITFSITNFLSIYFSEHFLEIDVIKYIISDEWLYNNLALVILFTISGAEAIFASMFVFEKLATLKIVKVKEKEIPNYCYFTIVGMYLFSILFYFISKNFYFLFIYMILIISLPIFKKLIDKVKAKEIFVALFMIVICTMCYVLCMFDYYYLVGLALAAPSLICSIVYLIKEMYNYIKGRHEL